MTVEFGRCAVHSQRVENPGNPGLQDNVDQMRVETVWLLDEVHRRLHCLARLATVESTFLWEQTRGLDQKEKKFKIGEKSLPLSLSLSVSHTETHHWCFRKNKYQQSNMRGGGSEAVDHQPAMPRAPQPQTTNMRGHSWDTTIWNNNKEIIGNMWNYGREQKMQTKIVTMVSVGKEGGKRWKKSDTRVALTNQIAALKRQVFWVPCRQPYLGWIGREQPSHCLAHPVAIFQI